MQLLIFGVVLGFFSLSFSAFGALVVILAMLLHLINCHFIIIIIDTVGKPVKIVPEMTSYGSGGTLNLAYLLIFFLHCYRNLMYRETRRD